MLAHFGAGRGWLAIVVLVGATLGCYERHPKVSSPALPPGSLEDRVGVDDVFEVRVYGEGDLSGPYRVAIDGTIDFPLAGRLKVVGLHCGEIQQLLVKELTEGKFLKSPQITVSIKDRNSEKVTVFGQVAKPGQVPFYPNMTIVDAIANAGGFTGIAAKNSVNLRREVEGKIETHVFPVADIAEGRSQNVLVLPGDVLVVDERVF
jgi:polysaccharide export outer membrane protein